jgi:hypothetical protein
MALSLIRSYHKITSISLIKRLIAVRIPTISEPVQSNSSLQVMLTASCVLKSSIPLEFTLRLPSLPHNSSRVKRPTSSHQLQHSCKLTTHRSRLSVHPLLPADSSLMQVHPLALNLLLISPIKQLLTHQHQLLHMLH